MSALAKTQFNIFVDGAQRWFAPGEEVPDHVIELISNKEGCLEDEGVFQVDFSSLPIETLKEIIVGRGLAPAKTKAAMLKQLTDA